MQTGVTRLLTWVSLAGMQVSLACSPETWFGSCVPPRRRLGCGNGFKSTSERLPRWGYGSFGFALSKLPGGFTRCGAVTPWTGGLSLGLSLPGFALFGTRWGVFGRGAVVGPGHARVDRFSPPPPFPSAAGQPGHLDLKGFASSSGQGWTSQGTPPAVLVGLI